MIEILPNWHPIFVHFTIALLAISVLLFVLAIAARSQTWSQDVMMTAHWNLWLGAAFTVITIGAGLYAYNTVAHDDPSHAAMTDHRNWAFATAALFWSLALFSGWKKKLRREPSMIFVAALVLSSGILLTTAWKGGELVYRYGLGVMSMPQSEGEGHEHVAGQGHADEADDNHDVEKDDDGHVDDHEH